MKVTSKRYVFESKGYFYELFLMVLFLKFEKDQKRKYYANLVKERNDQILSNGLPSERSRRETSYDKQKKNKAILYETRKDYARAVKETNDERFEKKKQKNSIDRLRDFEKRGEEIVKQKENKVSFINSLKLIQKFLI